MTELNLNEKLCKIQGELKAPKGQYNGFGKYKYRSCEDILEALKPLLTKYEMNINISDNIIQVGDRYYVQAQVKITDVKTNESVYSAAFAREEENKKGMDASQVTGAASSYARKYALNGLLAIDDTKDSDALNVNKDYTERPKTSNKDHTKDQEIEHMFSIAKSAGVENTQILEKMRRDYGKARTKDLTNEEIGELISWISQESFA